MGYVFWLWLCGWCWWSVRLSQGLGGWGGVKYVSGLIMLMAGPGICILCLADTCASYVHPVFNHVAPYRYLLSNMYLSVAYIANTDLFGCICRTWIRLYISCIYEEQYQPSSRSA